MSLALVLAGPIVRRVEPDLASVWVALSAPCSVQLDLWEGRVRAGSSQPAFSGTPEPALRAGEHLFFSVATVDLEKTAFNLIPGRVYSYNLTFTGGPGGTQNLRSLQLLANRDAKEVDGKQMVKQHLALGYDQDMLPSFVMPPLEITDLCLVHGSCRRPQVETPDALVWVDDLIEKGMRDEAGARVARPHQLFLTGDQVYSDDVTASMLHMIGSRCGELMGSREMMPSHLFPPKAPDKGWPADLDHFPIQLRDNFIRNDARFSTADSGNHLISFAEFCVMHLFVWSNELWPEAYPTLAKMLEVPAALPDILKLHTGLGGESILTQLNKVNLKTVRDGHCKKLSEGYHRQKRALIDFRNGLAKVRRALANVATYMMFDDHEVTDDWNLSPVWMDRVYTSSSGGAIVRNGLLAYGLCQGWGNDPKRFKQDIKDASGSSEPSANKELLTLIPQLFPADVEGPAQPAVGRVEELLGLAGQKPPKPDEKPPRIVNWNYTVSGPRHTILALDVRTRRGRTQRIAAPENLSAESLAEQVPAATLAPGVDVLIVISSLTVLGPPVIDALLGPASYKIIDLLKHRNKAEMPGLNPDAIEAWPNNEIAFERLLERLEPYLQVVILSGDVHFATSAALSYFRKDGDRPARFAQFTSSGMKNLFPEAGRKASEYFALLQHVIAAKVDVERVAWKKSEPDLLSIPAGANIPPRFRRKLKESPVLLPTQAWPSGTRENPVRVPDWAWRVHVIRDTRIDAERPEAVRPAPLVPGNPGIDVAPDLDGYRKVAVRHVKELANINHDRQMVFASNLGVVRFQLTEGVLKKRVLSAVHDLFAIHAAPFDQEPEPYTRHVVQLSEDPAETRPKIEVK